MQTAMFRHCCGIGEVGDFDADVTTKELRTVIADWYTDIPLDPSAVIATTVPSQKCAIRALRGNGFKVVRRFKNANTNTMVTLWYKKL